MKKYVYPVLLLIIGAIAFGSCKKSNNDSATDPAQPGPYSSLNDFYSSVASPMQLYTVNAGTGGSFTTPKGTVVNIPGGILQYQSGNPVTGNVTIEFKDIYSKSDMLLNKMPPMLKDGRPLKSGGEFYIKARDGSSPLILSGAAPITIQQPLNGWNMDTGMAPFFLNPAGNDGWVEDTSNQGAVDTTTLMSYIFNLYSFETTNGNGLWCNSDNPNFFTGFNQISVSLHKNLHAQVHHADMYLLFNGINSMVHVYGNGTDAVYDYAPDGLACTLVAFGTGKDGKLYSSFVPINIQQGLAVNYSLMPTSEKEFRDQLEALNK